MLILFAGLLACYFLVFMLICMRLQMAWCPMPTTMQAAMLRDVWAQWMRQKSVKRGLPHGLVYDDRTMVICGIPLAIGEYRCTLAAGGNGAGGYINGRKV